MVEKRKSDQVLEFVETNTVTSDSVSQKFNMDRTMASHYLKSLAKHGHLIRSQINIKEIGGRFYRFDITKWGRDRLKWLRSNGRL